MSALVMLTPEEIETIRTGSLEDPTYRPFPSGRRARMEQEEEIRAEEEGREQESVALDEPSIIERTLAAQYWTRYALELAILLAPVTPGNPELKIVGLARAQGGPRSKTFGTRRITLGPWELLIPSVLLDDVSSRLTSRQQRKLQEILNGRTRPLPPELNAAFTRVLAQISPGVVEQARRLTKPEPRSRAVRDLLEQRDANATALSILTPYWRDLRPEEVSVPPPTALSMDQILAESATENDLITSDAAVFPGWERGGRPVAGWWEFQYRGHRMWIKNVNVSRAETETGADLVYVRSDPEAVVLVQYKRLSRDARGELYMPHDRRLASQIERMVAYRSDNDSPTVLLDHRIGPGFAFVKFIDNQAQRGLRDDELTRGWYLPAEYVRDMLPGEPQGPHGGHIYYITRERSISPFIFTGLVHDCWIGSRGEASSILREILRAPSAPLTLAVDQPVA